jgi:hypothetical protein
MAAAAIANLGAAMPTFGDREHIQRVLRGQRCNGDRTRRRTPPAAPPDDDAEVARLDVE